MVQASRLLVCGLTALACLTPIQVARAQSPVEASQSEAYDEARALYEEGVGRYETADYLGAIDLWTQAFTLLPNLAEYAKINADLIFNLARAHEKQFDVDNDPAQLRQAIILLERYIESLPNLYADDVAEFDAQKTKTTQVKTDIEARLDAYESSRPAGPASGPGDSPPEPGRSLVITGAVLTAVGGLALGASGYGMAAGAQANDISDVDPTDIDERRTQFDRGRSMNTIAIAGGVSAGVLIATGVALIVVGKKKGKESRVALTPWLAPNGGGLVTRARF
jgi:tetratricopeptide (TPR) repeat protein